MAGYRIEIIVDSTRLTNKYKQQYEKYFLNPKKFHAKILLMAEFLKFQI